MDIFASVTDRLAGLGYVFASVDEASVRYNIDKASTEIKINTNQSEVPEGLFYVWVDMAAGLFLKDKKGAGRLGEGFDFSAPAKKITEGDVSVEFAGASDGNLTPEARFDNMLNALINPPPSVFAAFRRLKW